MKRLFAGMLFGLFVASLCALAGCQDDTGGWDVGDDAGHPADGGDADAGGGGEDAGDRGEDAGDGGEDAGTPEFDIEFELENRSGRMLYVSEGVAGQDSCVQGAPWVAPNGGARFEDRCTICNCAEDDCPACTAPCPRGEVEDAEFDDGESRTYRWNGELWTTDTDDECEESHVPVGESLSAEFCWAESFDDETGGLEDSTCETIEFTLDPEQPDQTIRHVIDDGTEDPGVDFRMVNETDRDLYAEPNGATEGGQYVPACKDFWYEVSDGDDIFDLKVDCEECSCNDVDNGECSSECTGAACQRSEGQFLLEAGSERADEWDGSIGVDDEKDGVSCRTLTEPPTDDLEATFCYGDELTSSGGEPRVEEPTCETLNFNRLRDDEVVFRIDGE